MAEQTQPLPLPGGLSFLTVGDGPPLAVFPGLSRRTSPAGLAEVRREELKYRSLARITGRKVHIIYRPAGIPQDTTMPQLAALHAAALSSLTGAPIDVFGASTGGAIALQLAVDHPQVVRRLAVACAASWLGEDGRRRLRRYGERIRQGRSGAAVLASVLSGPLLRWPATAAIWLAERREQHIDPGDMLATIHAEVGFDVTARLGLVAAPTLVIGGESDRAFPPHLLRRTAKAIPNAKLILYPNRGHVGTMFDRRFGPDVAAFLNATG